MHEDAIAEFGAVNARFSKIPLARRRGFLLREIFLENANYRTEKTMFACKRFIADFAAAIPRLLNSHLAGTFGSIFKTLLQNWELYFQGV